MSEYDSKLYPVVVQNFLTGEILMLAYANTQALDLTRKTGFAHFYSRKRKKLWKKGETSKNFIPVFGIIKNCDNDAFIYMTFSPPEKVCHLKKKKCFFEKESPFLIYLERYIKNRKKSENSYTAKALKEDENYILRKIGEEALEVVLAKKEWLEECADLLFHIILLCLKRKKGLKDVIEVLFERHLKKSDFLEIFKG